MMVILAELIAVPLTFIWAPLGVLRIVAPAAAYFLPNRKIES